MNWYICTTCGRYSYSAADPDTVINGRCPQPDCNGYTAPASEPRRAVIKPPLGIMPECVWKELRRDALKEAVNRCFDRDYPVQPQWIEEYNRLVKEAQP